MRTLIRELPDVIGKTVEISGWLHKRRLLGGLNFIIVRDRTGLVQILDKTGKASGALQGLHAGTVVTVRGQVVKDERAMGGVELHDPEIKVDVAVSDVMPIEIDKPINHQPEHLDTLFEHRVINIRNPVEQLIFRIRSSLNRYIREFLTEHEFIEIQTPKILAGATEGGAEVFELDYFDQKATLAQSPQLYKQIMVGAFERVFEIGSAFRAEPSTTTRHMSEVSMLDIEMGFIESHDDVLELTQQLLYTILTRIYSEHADDLKALGAPKLVIRKELPRFTVAEVHELYSQEHEQNTVGEKDLRPDEEKWICDYTRDKHGSEAVFITELPVEAMKFYHMINPANPKVVLSADLLFRGIELATVPQREHRYDRLVAQIKQAGIDPEHPGFRYYLQAFRYGLPPHGGFGFGIDRLTEKVIGLNNVKEAALFPRDMQRLTP